MIEKKILDNLLAGYWTWDFQTNKVWLSRRLVSSLGYLEEELGDDGDVIRSKIDPDDLKRFDAEVAKHIENRGESPFSVDLRYYHKNGNIIWINCTGSVTEWSEEGLPLKLLGCHVDITQTKLYEELLIKERELFQDFFDINPDLMCIVGKDGSFVKINQQWEKTLGFSMEEILMRKITDFIHIDDLPAVYEIFALPQEPNAVIQLTNRFRCKDGSYRHLEWRTRAKGNLIYAAARDITLRIKALSELAFMQKTNLSIIQSMSEGIILQDKDGKILQHNESAERILGLSREQLLGKTSIDKLWNTVREDGTAFPSEEHPPMQVLKNGKPVFNEIMGVRKPDGTLMWVLVNSVPIYELDNMTINSVVTSFTDITELKQKQEQISQSVHTITEQKNRLESFAHIVSHNLRSHAGNIYSLIEFLLQTSDEKEKAQLLDFLKKTSEQLIQTITDLNEIVDAQKATERKVITIKPFFERVLNSISQDIKKQAAKIQLDIPDQLTISYKPAYLESIFLNFITNGIKYRHPDRNPEIHVRVFQEKNKIIMTIRDNGIGIDLKKYKDSLFGMYKTFHGNKDAKGIGLYITKNQVEEMGGKIEVESEVGVGTTFTVYFTV